MGHYKGRRSISGTHVVRLMQAWIDREVNGHYHKDLCWAKNKKGRIGDLFLPE